MRLKANVGSEFAVLGVQNKLKGEFGVCMMKRADGDGGD